jgi:organic radical activating enzyme
MIVKDDYKNFCVLPFINAYEGNQSVYKICCEYQDAAHDNEFAKVWNSDFYKDVRQQMNERNMPEACKVCVEDELHGLESHRMYCNARYKDLTEKFFNNPVTEVDAPTIIDLRLSNKCNLECVMCQGYNSSAIDKRVKAWSKPLSIQTTKGDLQTDKTLVQYLKNNVKSIQELHFAGGEPFMIQEIIDVLQFCVDNDHAKNICLQMTTNTTIARRKWIEQYLLKFKDVKLVCSVDGVGENLEYIRFPSKWSVIKRNLLYFKELSNTHENFQFHLSPCIHIMNLKEFPALIDFATEHKIDIQCNIVYKSSQDDFLSFNKLPLDFRKDVVEQIQQRKKAMEGIVHNLFDKFLYRIANDPQVMLGAKEQQNFIDQVEYWDSHKPKFADSFPHLTFLIDKQTER